MLKKSYILKNKRHKKYYNYPLTNNPDHYYRLMMLQKTLDTWSSCFDLIMRFKKERCGPIELWKSKSFEMKIKVEESSVPGFVTRSTLRAMLTYMNRLESRIEQLETVLYARESNIN